MLRLEESNTACRFEFIAPSTERPWIRLFFRITYLSNRKWDFVADLWRRITIWQKAILGSPLTICYAPRSDTVHDQFSQVTWNNIPIRITLNHLHQIPLSMPQTHFHLIRNLNDAAIARLTRTMTNSDDILPRFRFSLFYLKFFVFSFLFFSHRLNSHAATTKSRRCSRN